MIEGAVLFRHRCVAARFRFVGKAPDNVHAGPGRAGGDLCARWPGPHFV
jgi:hypothetical protein